MTDSPSNPIPTETGPIHRVVVGLGNPGEKYLATRHNVGFRVIEELVRRFPKATRSQECNSEVYSLVDDASALEIRWVLPQTFMNRSGFAVRCLRERLHIDPRSFLIVYDEVHLPLGSLRLRTQGSPGGHRGMESIIENLGTDAVARLRMGVGAGELDGAELVDFVLGEFSPEEEADVEAMIRRAADACEAWCQDGAESVMRKFNGPPPQ